MSKQKTRSKRPLLLQWARHISRKALLVGLIFAILGIGFLFKSFAATPGASADLNGDGQVNITDLSILLANYGKAASASKGDIDGDGTVDLADLSQLLSAYGKPVTPPPTIPPPPPPPPTQPPTPPPTGSKLPGQLLNLKNWYLTLPTGSGSSPDSVYQPTLDKFSNTFFQVNAAQDGVVFMAPVDGAHTSNSVHTRSELRETASNGTLPWGWSTGSGSHTLTATQSIQHLPSSTGKLSFAQIHGPGSTWYLILMATGTGNGTAKLTVKDETGKADGQVIASNYKLGTKFDLVVSAINGKITMSYNGTQVVSTTSNMSGSYFKIGTYNQSDGDYGQVTIHSLGVSHK